MRNGEIFSKHVFAGNTRLATTMVKRKGTAATELGVYYYHGDHLGSSNVITDRSGQFHEHLEYFPYGETWVHEKASSGAEYMAHLFTGKEKDTETGLYSFEHRYYDPRLGRWLSVDPPLVRGEYFPQPNDFDTEHDYYWYLHQDASKKLPGMGGVFNPTNLDVYCYTLNNPVRYIDPDGNTTKLNEGEVSLLDLSRAQEKTTQDPEYVRGGGGHLKADNPNNTWCNQATFDVIEQTHGDISKFVNDGGRYNTRANDSIDAMRAQAAKGNLNIIDGEKAQSLANKGYTVIAGVKGENGRSGHVVTVVSSYGKYNSTLGPKVAHVGAGKNETRSAKGSFGNLKNVQYFYDPNQKLK